MILLFDIGNTHTHIGLADDRRVLKQTDIPTLDWFGGDASARVKKFAGEENHRRGFVQRCSARHAAGAKDDSRDLEIRNRSNSRRKLCAAWALIIRSRNPSGRIGWRMRWRHSSILARRSWWWILERR